LLLHHFSCVTPLQIKDILRLTLHPEIVGAGLVPALSRIEGRRKGSDLSLIRQQYPQDLGMRVVLVDRVSNAIASSLATSRFSRTVPVAAS
jgi:hypothetical protein